MIYQAWVNVPEDPKPHLDGQTVVITGANSGIGLEAAVKVVQLGASKVIIAVRSAKKGDEAKEIIERRAKKTGVVEVMLLDMGNYDSVKSFAGSVAKLERLDAVMLNAGIHPAKFSTSQYGWNETFQVNTFSTVLLALLLLPVLQKTAGKTGIAHLEFTGSGTYKFAKIDEAQREQTNILESYNNEQEFQSQRHYAFSKMVLYCATKTIVSKLGENSKVIVTNVCPGMVATDLARDFTTNIGIRVALQIMKFLVMRNSEQGARTLVRGIMLGKEAHGRFWQHDMVQP